MKEAYIYYGVLWCFIHFNFSSYVIYKQHFFFLLQPKILILKALHYITLIYKLHYIVFNCITVCQNNTFGSGCSENCGHCLRGLQCHHVTGSCNFGCAPGYYGSQCKTGNVDAKLLLLFIYVKQAQFSRLFQTVFVFFGTALKIQENTLIQKIKCGGFFSLLNNTFQLSKLQHKHLEDLMVDLLNIYLP